MRTRIDVLAVTILVTAGPIVPLSAQQPQQEFKLRETLKGPDINVHSVAYSPDGKSLAAGTIRGDVVVWDTRANKQRVFEGHTQLVKALQFSPDSKTLASAGGLDGTVRLWNVETGKPLHTLTLPKKSPTKEAATGVSFHPDGKHVAACGFFERIPIWDVATGKQVDVLSGEGARCLAYSPDGRFLAYGSSPQSVRLRDLAAAEEKFVAGINMNSVFAIDFSPDSTMIAMAGSHRMGDNVIRLWDVATRREFVQLRGHGTNVLQVRFTPDNKRLVSTAYDKTVRLWDIADGKLLAALKREDREAQIIHSLALSPDGETLAIPDGKAVGLWIVPRAAK